ncbi:hypothetical protein GJU40_04485 [Bacillus lacus]|uniref:Pilus assembly protein PilO n=1 Tax=Metabacillus lacus TaxID=1983721 RepID=A0A7X2IX69_9BACI|nr:hypothetical protein [Metabacillus lacus]MRX71430.1 hypothetical protein [Metabacillus lacus]
MNNMWTKLYWMLLSFFGILLSVILAGYYFFFLTGIEREIESASSLLAAEKQLLESVAQNSEGQMINKQTAAELQKRIPVDPFEEQFLLELEKAEIISNTFITNLAFSESVFEIQPPEAEAAVSTESEQENAASSENGEVTEEAEASGGEAAFLPAGLEMLSVQANVTAANYYDMQQFLISLEKMQRIVQIEDLTITGQPEITSLEQDIGDYEFSVSLNSFYMPGLTELKNSLPGISAPVSSNKHNPFQNYLNDSAVITEEYEE